MQFRFSTKDFDYLVAMNGSALRTRPGEGRWEQIELTRTERLVLLELLRRGEVHEDDLALLLSEGAGTRELERELVGKHVQGVRRGLGLGGSKAIRFKRSTYTFAVDLETFNVVREEGHWLLRPALLPSEWLAAASRPEGSHVTAVELDEITASLVSGESKVLGHMPAGQRFSRETMVHFIDRYPGGWGGELLDWAGIERPENIILSEWNDTGEVVFADPDTDVKMVVGPSGRRLRLSRLVRDPTRKPPFRRPHVEFRSEDGTVYATTDGGVLRRRWPNTREFTTLRFAPKLADVLRLLLAARGGMVSKDKIARHVWPDSVPAKAASSVENAMSRIRRELGNDMVPAERDNAYRLEAEFSVSVEDAATDRSAMPAVPVNMVTPDESARLELVPPVTLRAVAPIRRADGEIILLGYLPLLNEEWINALLDLPHFPYDRLLEWAGVPRTAERARLIRVGYDRWLLGSPADGVVIAGRELLLAEWSGRFGANAQSAIRFIQNHMNPDPGAES